MIREPGIVPVMVPRLPPTDAVMPLMRRIDQARWYSNFGPLAAELNTGLADLLGVGDGQIECFTSGTAALTVALQAVTGGRAGLCLMPAFTFCATAAAAMAAGLTPWFVDITRQDCAIAPRQVEGLLPQLPGPVAAVMPVAPFGAPLDIAAWDDFTRRTGIPVVVDAAAAIDRVRPGRSLTMVSLHATKPLGVGEGGMLVSTDASLIRQAREWGNFGFANSRSSKVAGGNAKIDEYRAALGLAALGQWSATRRDYISVSIAYHRRLADNPRIRFLPGFDPHAVVGTLNVELDVPAMPVMARMRTLGVDTRQWWGLGLHREPAYAACGRGDLSVTDDLAPRIIGLPCYRDLSEAEIDTVCGALQGAIG